jgi:hypothetical protein
MAYPVTYEKPGYRNIDPGASTNKLRGRDGADVRVVQEEIGYRSGAAGDVNNSREVGGAEPRGDDLRGYVTPAATAKTPTRRANDGVGKPFKRV